MASILKQEIQQSLKDNLAEIARNSNKTPIKLSHRVASFFANPLATLPAHVDTETGSVIYSSLSYDRAETAEQAFKTFDPHVYARNGNPAATELVEYLKYFEPDAVTGQALAHGMTAVSTVTDALVLGGYLKAGDQIVASRFLFGSCRKLIEQLRAIGIDVALIDGRDLQQWHQAVTAETKLVFFETPGNPTLELVDIAAVATLVHEKSRALVVVDNSLEFPAQAPLSLGADITVASLTKILGPDIATGGGTDSGGVILLSSSGLDRLQNLTGSQDNIFFDHILRRGGLIAARVAVEMLKRLPYLEPRFQRQSQSSRILAEHIATHYPAIAVLSPHLARHPQAELAARQMKGSVVFTLDLGSRYQAFNFINFLIPRGIGYVNNFYSYKTTLTHPASTTHHSLSAAEQRSQGLNPGHVRLSVGIEDVDLLIRLFDEAFAAVHVARHPSAERIAS